MNRIHCFITLCLLLAGSAGATTLPAYSVRLISMYSDEWHGFSYALNDRGQVVAEKMDPTGSIRPFRWDQTGATTALSCSTGEVRGINNGGTAVGWVGNPTRNYATSWDEAGNPHQLSTLESYGWGINDQGQIAGEIRLSGMYRGCVWDDLGTMTALATLGGDSGAKDINMNGVAVGFSATSGQGVACAWNLADGSVRGLSTLAGVSSCAWAVNDPGAAVGCAKVANGNVHAAYWDANGLITDLGTLGGADSYAFGINGSGYVVGSAFTASRGSHAFIWQPGQNSVVDLNTKIDPLSGWSIVDAMDINEDGWIVGYGYNPLIGDAAVLLQPVPEAPSFIGLLMCSAGAALLSLRRKMAAMTR